MKKLLSYSLIFVAFATIGVTEARIYKPTATQKRDAREGHGILKNVQAAEAAVVTAVDSGASEEQVDKMQSTLSDKIDAAKDYLKKKKQSFDEMSLTRKLVIAAIASATVVAGIDYAKWGNEGYMAQFGSMMYNAMPMSVQNAFSSTSKYVSENIITPVTSRVRSGVATARSYLPSMPSRPSWLGGTTVTAPSVTVNAEPYSPFGE